MQMTHVIQYSPNCPSPYLVRIVGKGAAALDNRLNIGNTPTTDCCGYGKTLERAARQAIIAKYGSLNHPHVVAMYGRQKPTPGA